MARNTWPIKGKRYWYVDLVLGTFIVGSTDYDGTSFDDERLNIGNYYRTKLEAEQAKDRVLAALKPVPAHETFLKKQLPDWCKVGAWVCNQNEDYFCKIIEIAKDKKSFTAAQPGKNYTIGSGDLNYGFDKWKPACLRPWTFDEAPAFVKTKETDHYRACCWILSGIVRNEVQFYTHKDNFASSSEMMAFTQIDGSPCGVLEVVEE
mgnify:CR=1 FL=1